MGELNHPNHNGRIYDSKMMQEAIDKWKKDGNKIVELNPDYGSIDHFSEPRLYEAAGKVEDIWIKDNKVVGKIQLLDTPKGKIAQTILDEKVKESFQINPRMLGEKIPVLNEEGQPMYDKDGNQIYEIKDVEIVSFDLV